MNKISKKVVRRISFLLSMLLMFESIFYGSNVTYARTVTETVSDVEQNLNEEGGAEPIVSAIPTPLEEISSVEAEDLNVSSAKTLTEDTIVNNLTISNKYLNLNGYKLTVLGNICITSGYLTMNSGNVLCYGNCTVLNNAYIKMDNQSDSMKVCGDFVTKTSRFTTITAGVLEIEGDFSQIKYTDNDLFYTSGTSEVVFSGSEEQNINFDSDKCYFSTVILKNKSMEGVKSEGLINSLSIVRNDTKVSCGIEGKMGWTLRESETYDGDLILEGGTLDLKGHTLNVTGNFIHANGTVKMNGGTLKIGGDYRMQKPVIDENSENTKFLPSISQLKMSNAKDVLDIEGDIYIQSQLAAGSSIRNGEMRVAGDVWQLKSAVTANFAPTKDSVLILDGTKKQTISLESDGKGASSLNHLEIMNKNGIELLTNVSVLGEVKDHKNSVSGHALIPYTSTTFQNNEFAGNILLNDPNATLFSSLRKISGDFNVNVGNVRLCSELDVDGDFLNTATFALNGHSLKIGGDAVIESGFTVDSGRFIVGKSLTLKNNGYLNMENVNGHVLVNGDMMVQNRNEASNMKKGILELRGDFTQKTTNKKGNFQAQADHVTVFSGDMEQTIIFEDTYSYFGIVELQNKSAEGVYAQNGINCKTLNKNGTVYKTDLEGVDGWTLTKDETFEGNLTLNNGTLDLAGHTLIVTGDLIQEAGTIKVNGGRLLVKGDYRIQSVNESTESSAISYGKSLGYLNMTKVDDVVDVNGDFYMGSMYSHLNLLTKGKLIVAGNVEAISYDSLANFYGKEDFTLVLDGKKKQILKFSNPEFGRMCVGNLILENESEDGIVLDGVLPVWNKVTVSGNKLVGKILVSRSTTFDSKEISFGIQLSDNVNGLCGLTKIDADVSFGKWCWLKQDVEITGNVSVLGNSQIQLNGHTLKVGGNLTLNGGCVYLEGGKLYVDSNLTLASNISYPSYLTMNKATDYVCVNGDFFAGSYTSTNSYNYGTLEIRGDFKQINSRYTNNFISGENCNVILNGKKLQTITFNGMDSYFGKVIINNTSSEGVYSQTGIQCINLITNGNIYKTENEGTHGWVLKEDQVISEDLTLVGGVLDLNGHTLTVKGNFHQRNGIVKINGGVLNVEGDYKLQGISGKGTWASLHMMDESDEVRIGGNFTTYSFANHYGYLAAGTMYVAGNIVEKKTLASTNFKSSGAFTLVMNGEKAQNVIFNETKGYSSNNQDYSIANLIVDNSSPEGVKLNHTLVTGKVIIKNGKIGDELSISNSTLFENNTYDGDIIVRLGTTLKNKLHIKGDFKVASDPNSTYLYLGADIKVDGNLVTASTGNEGKILLLGHTLDVAGNITLFRYTIDVSQGRLLCGGDLNIPYCEYYTTGLCMSYVEDYVLVKGDMNANSFRTPLMNNGTLELKGGFTSTTNNKNTCFYQSVSGKTIFSGNAIQKVSIANAASSFGTIIIQNESREGVYFLGNTIQALEIDKRGNYVYCDGTGEWGWTLKEDTVLEGDLVIIGDELNLNGYTLTVNGNLFLNAGDININGGNLTVNGDFRIQSYNANKDYTFSKGSLIMTQPSDKVVVEGDFVSASSISSMGKLTAGTMELHGDFEQVNMPGANGSSFVSTQSHTVMMAGKRNQKISFANFTSSYFNHLTIDNKVGVTLNSHCYVYGKLKDLNNGLKPSAAYYVYMPDINNIADGICSGSICVKNSKLMQEDVTVEGTLVIESNLDLSGFTLSCDDLIHNSGTIDLSEGRIYIAGNYTSNSNNSSIKMTNDQDSMCVKGNMLLYGNNSFTAGILEVCGDLVVNGSGYNAFNCTGRHITILSGKVSKLGRNYIQYITLNHPSNHFNKVVLYKDLETCYIFNKDLESISNVVVKEPKDQKAPDKVTGVKITEVTASTVNLSWEASKDDDSVAGYQVFRGTKLVGMTDGLSYKDTGLLPNTNYVYTVYAFDQAQNLSIESDQIMTTTSPDTESPTIPTAVKLVTWTGSSVTLSWRDSKDNVEVASYKIYRDGEEYAVVDGNVKVYKDNALATGESHTYSVTAIDSSSNESEMSNVVKASAENPQITSMSPETDSSIGGTNVSLKLFYKNFGSGLGNKVRFQYSEDNGENWKNINTSLVGQKVYNASTLYSSYTWDISRMKDGIYKIRATLYDADNNTDSTEVQYTLDTSGPAAPESIEAVSENGTVTVSWSESDSANCSYYLLYRASDGESFNEIRTISGRQNTTYTDFDVQEGTTYFYYVVPVDVYEQKGNNSEHASVTVAMDSESPKVTHITASKAKVNKNTSFTVGASDNIGVTRTKIQYLEGNEWVTVGESGDSVYQVKIMGKLPKDGKYQFRGIAIDAKGNEGIGGITEMEVDTKGVSKPNISNISSTSNTVRIEWAQPADEDFDYYVVEQKVGDQFEQVAKEKKTLGVYIRKLSIETKYTFRIVGYDTTGNRGEYSDEISIKTKSDTTAPRVKLFNPAICYYKNSIPLSIEATDDNNLGEMKISYSTDNKTWTKAATITAPKGKTNYVYTYDLDISKLPEGEVYVHVDLFDAYGNMYLNDVTRTFYHDLTAPAVMKNLTAKGNDGFIEVKWTKPDEPDFASFSLFRMDNKTGKYECVAKDTTALNYIDTSITTDETYSYKLKVNDQAGNQSEYSNVAVARGAEDTTPPQIYGIAPQDKTVIGVNETIRMLVADNRSLENVIVEYHQVGTVDCWTEIYSNKLNVSDEVISFTWRNEHLEEGDYEIRVIVTDEKGNVNDDYVVTYTFSKKGTQIGGTGDSEGDKGEIKIPEKEQDSIIAVVKTTEIQRCGKEYTFDASESLFHVAAVKNCTWDFGDGTEAKGVKVTHIYEKEGDYKVSLTVEDRAGNSQTTNVNVNVVNKSSGGVAIGVFNEYGVKLPEAYVYISDDKGETVLSTKCGQNGVLEEALDAGTYNISVYYSGYLPKEEEIKISKGATKQLTFHLKQDQVVVGTLTHRELSVNEIIELGIDLTNEANWYTYYYTVQVYTNGLPSGKTYSFPLGRGGSASFKDDKGHSYTYTTASGQGGEKILLQYNKIQWLKQMFDVQLTLTNQAGESFLITNGEAQLILPNGLSLAAMTDRQQSLSVKVPDIPGQTNQVIDWYVRGDRTGEYNLAVKFAGILQPFAAPVSAYIEDKEPLVVKNENKTTSTDPDFLDDPDNAEEYEICVMDLDGEKLKGANVELADENGNATRAITNSFGQAILSVEKDDNRIFKLTVTCAGYKQFVDHAYKVNSDYYDIVRMAREGEDYPEEFPDENKDYEGDFKLKYATLDGKDLAEEAFTINTYTKKAYRLRMGFNDEVRSCEVLLREDGKNTKIIESKERENAEFDLSINSKDLKAGMELCVKVVDSKTGSWHLYCFKNVAIVYKAPYIDFENFEKFNYNLAVDCAIYSALAYDDEFSYDNNTQCLVDMPPNYEKNQYVENIDLLGKLFDDGYTCDLEFARVNYGDDNNHNCSYSIFYKTDNKNGSSQTYICVVVRGTDGLEWCGNMEVTGQKYDPNEENHKDFALAADGVYENVLRFINKHKIKDAYIIATGHSRGGAVSNLLAKRLIDNKTEIGLKGITAYTFAAPSVTIKKDTLSDKYKSIFNFCFEDDFVPHMPLSDWNYRKYGIPSVVDSEELSKNNKEYMNTRRKIRVNNKTINYNSNGTLNLRNHIKSNWHGVEDYYKGKHNLNFILIKTLYEVMHDYVAPAAAGFKIKGLPVWIERMFDISDISVYYAVCKFFYEGNDSGTLFDTHHIDNYYAALVNKGFDLSVFETSDNQCSLRQISKNRYDTSSIEIIKQSKDIEQFKKFLNRKELFQNEKGETVNIPIYKIYGYDIDDISTWYNISFDQEGNITSIELPLYSVTGKLDLTEFVHLKKLVVMYTGLDGINLSGCTALSELIVEYNSNLTEIDLGDCENLQNVDLTGNALTNIKWSNCATLKYIKCEGNHLDVYSPSMQKVLELVKKNDGQSVYQSQEAKESDPYDEDEVNIIKNFLRIGNNASILGWNTEDISSWKGVQWKVVSGQNHIDRIDVSNYDVRGTLDVTEVTYLRELVCSGTKITAIDVSGLKYLVQLTCLYSELEQLTFLENDALLYMDCRYNYLNAEDIVNVCREFELREGAQIFYEKQYVGADKVKFNAKECEVLKTFIDNQKNVNWNMDKPGSIPGITWKYKDGEYRVEKLDLSIYNINLSGYIDLSAFEELVQINMSKTLITRVTLPKNLNEISMRAFYACDSLTEIEIPETVQIIGQEAFANCRSLHKIIFLGNAPLVLGDDLFNNVAEDFAVYHYASKDGWDSDYWENYNLVVITDFPQESKKPLETPSIFSSARPSPSTLPDELSDVEKQTPSMSPIDEKATWTERPRETDGNMTTRPLLPKATRQPDQTEEPQTGMIVSPRPQETTAQPIQSTKPKPPKVTAKPINTKEPENSEIINHQFPQITAWPVQTKEPNSGSESANYQEGKGETELNSFGGKHSKATIQKKIPKIKILKIIKGKKSVTVIVRKNKKVNGYVLAYRKGKKGKYRKKVLTSSKSNRFVIRKLKKGNKYSLKVRGFIIVNGKKYYSPYSKLKTFRFTKK